MLLGIGLVVSPYRLSANMAVADEVDVALKGGQARDVQVGEHRFHIEPIVVTRTANQINARGIIFHVVKYFPDDQIRYIIEVRDGMQTFDVQMSEGALGRLVPLLGGLQNFAGSVNYGGWQLSAGEILDAIAARIQAGN